MLTEIEWWGGMLFIWLAFSCVAIYKVYSDEPKIEVGFLSFIIAFLLSFVVLSLYFYSLESQLTKQVYIGSVALGLCMTTLWFFWPESDSIKENNSAEEEEDEIGKGYETLAQFILLFPLVIAFGLGAYKSMDFLDSLTF